MITERILEKAKKRLIVVLVVALIATILYGAKWATTHEKIEEASSPDNKYTVTAYLDNGGATTPYSILCMVRKNKIGFSRKIYYQYRCDEADIEWLDNQTVIINGIELDVKKDTYEHWNE